MADSTCMFEACSHASEAPNGERKMIILSALSESVSFGRFVSESLDWGKWSSFNHNKYLEEAEMHSRPGSVAQKKAFFEARYKKKAGDREAAATSGIQADSSPERESGNSLSISEITTIDTGHISEPVAVGGSDLDGENQELEVERDQEIGIVVDDKSPLDSSEAQEKQPLQESCVTNQDSVDNTAKKRRSPVSKSLMMSRSPKISPFPAKNVQSSCCAKENKSTPTNLKNRKRLTQSSVQMSANFGIATPSRTERKSESSQEHLIQFKTPASSEGLPKLVSVTPKLKHGRMGALSDLKFSGRTGDAELRTSSVKNSKIMCSKGSRLSSAELSSSRPHKTDKRKEMEEKSESELRAFGQKLCFKARPLPSFYRKSDVAKESNEQEKSESELRTFGQKLCFKARPLPSFYRKSDVARESNKQPTLQGTQSPSVRITSDSKVFMQQSSVKPPASNSTCSTHSARRNLGAVRWSIASFLKK